MNCEYYIFQKMHELRLFENKNIRNLIVLSVIQLIIENIT